MTDTPAYLDLAKHRPPLGWQLQRRHFQWQTSPLGQRIGNAGDKTPPVQPLRQAAQLVGLPPELGDGSGFSNFVDSSDSLPDINAVVRDLPPTAQIPEINRTPAEGTRYPSPLNSPPILRDFETEPPQEDQEDRETFNRQSLFEENSGSTDSSSTGTQDIARKEANRYPDPLVGNNPDIPIRHTGGSPMLGDFETKPPQDQGGREAFNQPSLFEETFGFTDTEDTSTVDPPVDDQSIDSVKKLPLDGQPPSPLQRLPLGQRQPLGFNRPAITSDSAVPVQRLPNIELSPLDTSEQSLSGPSVDAAEPDVSQPDVSQPTDDSPALRASAEISPETSLENPIQRTPTTPPPEESVTATTSTESSTDNTIPLGPLPLEQDNISDISTADATVSPVQQLPVETAPEVEPPIDSLAHPPSDSPTDGAIDVAPTESPIEPTPTDILSDTIQTAPDPSLTSPLPFEQPDLTSESPASKPASPDLPAVAHTKPFSELPADITPQSLAEPPTPDTVSQPEPTSTEGAVIQPKPILPETAQPDLTQFHPESAEQSSELTENVPTADSLPENIAQRRPDLSTLEGTGPEAIPQDVPALEEHSPDRQPHVPNDLPASTGETSSTLEPTETLDQSTQIIPQPDLPLAAEQSTVALPVVTETSNPVETGQPVQPKLLSDAVTQPLGKHKPMFDGLQDTIKERSSSEPARSQVPTIQAKQTTDQPTEPLSSRLVALTSKYGLPDEPPRWLESAASLETAAEEPPIAELSETVALSVTDALAEMAENNTAAQVSSGEEEDQALWQLAHLLYSELRKDWVVRSQISDNFQHASPALLPIQSGDNKYSHLPLTLWPPPAHQLITAVKQQLTIRLRQDSHRRAQPSTLRSHIS